MKIWIQWAQSTPQDYVMYDLSARNVLKNIPSKPEPPVGETNTVIDNNPGWVNALNVQGVIFEGFDHYGLAYDASTRKATVSGWADDPVDNPEGWFYATSWDFFFPKGDPKLAGRMNTDQKRTLYFTPGDPITTSLNSAGIPWVPYANFVKPPAASTRHGVWLSDALFEQHRAVRTEHVWEEWIGG